MNTTPSRAELRVPRLVDFDFGWSAREPLCADELIMVVNELADCRVAETRFVVSLSSPHDDVARVAEHARRRRIRTVLSITEAAGIEKCLDVPCDVVSLPPWFPEDALVRVSRSPADLELNSQLSPTASWKTDGEIVVGRGVSQWRIELAGSATHDGHVVARVRELGALPLERICIQNVDRDGWRTFADSTSPLPDRQTRLVVGSEEKVSIRRNGDVVFAGAVVGSVRERQIIPLYSACVGAFEEESRRSRQQRWRGTRAVSSSRHASSSQ
jgi:hypothetical protein